MSGLTIPKIYGFVNGRSPGWYDVCAIAEDGACLASHICSHPAYGPHDIGVTSDWKHECYALYYPQGFEVEWVDEADIADHVGLQAAFAAARAMTPEESLAKVAHVTAELDARRRAREAQA